MRPLQPVFHDRLQDFAFLLSGCGMFLFLKQIPTAERLIKRNPLFLPGVSASCSTRWSTRASTRAGPSWSACRARVIGWARALPGYGDYDFKGPFSALPLLSKSRLQNEALRFQRRTVMAAARGRNQRHHRPPLKLKRSMQSDGDRAGDVRLDDGQGRPRFRGLQDRHVARRRDQGSQRSQPAILGRSGRAEDGVLVDASQQPHLPRLRAQAAWRSSRTS